MNFKDHLRTAILMVAVTTVLLGIVYPLVVTGMAQLLFPDQANGQLIEHDGHPVGSRLIGQPFSGPGYFHPRPSAAGDGYDPTASGGTNFSPTNAKLVQRVSGDVATLQAENPNAPIPIDLVTASGSGLDPDITPAAAEFQIPRVARERDIPENELRQLVQRHTTRRTLRILGEPRVNVVGLNLDLDARKKR